MPQFNTIDDLDVAGRRVLVRADLNVPVHDGRVTDATRLDRVAPTVKALAERGAKVILLSHFGRPDGRRVLGMSLRPVVPALSDVLGGRQVAFAEDCIGPAAERAVEALPEGGVLVLENLRFHRGEETNDAEFAAALARCGEFYVNDAFSAAHRAHASIEALARLLPAAAGRNMQAELEALAAALEAPERPVAAVVGGAKVSSKIDVLSHLVARMDAMVIGGGMANTFLRARGLAVGTSLCEPDLVETARRIERRAEAAGCRLLLPIDVVVATAPEAVAAAETVAVDAVPTDRMILDLGPATLDMLETELESWRTLLWNGPLGAFETPPFDAATTRFACAAAGRTKAGTLTTVAGGGDTVAALANAGVVDRFSYVSTAGGAFLEWLEGRILPGVKALEEAVR